MKKIIIILLIILIAGIFIYKITYKNDNLIEKQDGYAQFSIGDDQFLLDNLVFIIRPHPYTAQDAGKIKTVPKGKGKFEFKFSETVDKLKSEIEKSRKVDMNSPVETFQYLQDNNKFLIWWFADTDDPIKHLESNISCEDYEDMVFEIIINGNDIYNRDESTCWIKFDKITDERAIGRFGGDFKVIPWLDTKSSYIQQQIRDGVFNVPIEKFYK